MITYASPKFSIGLNLKLTPFTFQWNVLILCRNLLIGQKILLA